MQNSVQEFHAAMGQTIGTTPGIRDSELRASLVYEEAMEFVAALGYRVFDGVVRQVSEEADLVAAIDALGDLLYVVFGSAVAFGVDLQPFFDEIHRSNMTKVGGEKRADGKQLKPETYEPPNLVPILEQQATLLDAYDFPTCREHPPEMWESDGTCAHHDVSDRCTACGDPTCLFCTPPDEFATK